MSTRSMCHTFNDIVSGSAAPPPPPPAVITCHWIYKHAYRTHIPSHLAYGKCISHSTTLGLPYMQPASDMCQTSRHQVTHDWPIRCFNKTLCLAQLNAL